MSFRSILLLSTALLLASPALARGSDPLQKILNRRVKNARQFSEQSFRTFDRTLKGLEGLPPGDAQIGMVEKNVSRDLNSRLKTLRNYLRNLVCDAARQVVTTAGALGLELPDGYKAGHGGAWDRFRKRMDKVHAQYRKRLQKRLDRFTKKVNAKWNLLETNRQLGFILPANTLGTLSAPGLSCVQDDAIAVIHVISREGDRVRVYGSSSLDLLTIETGKGEAPISGGLAEVHDDLFEFDLGDFPSENYRVWVANPFCLGHGHSYIIGF